MVSLSIVPWLKYLLRFTQLMKLLLSFKCTTGFHVFANTRKNRVFVAILVIRAKTTFFGGKFANMRQPAKNKMN